MPTDTSELGLERRIVRHLAGNSERASFPPIPCRVREPVLPAAALHWPPDSSG